MYCGGKMMFVCMFLFLSFFAFIEVSVDGAVPDKEADELSKKLDKLVHKAALEIKNELDKSNAKYVTNTPFPATYAPTTFTNAPFPLNIPKKIPGNVPGYVYPGPIYLPILYPPPQMIANKIVPKQNQPAQSKGMDLLLKKFESIFSLGHNKLIKVESNPPCDSYDEVARTCWFDKQIGQQLKLRPKFYDMQGKELDLEDLNVRWHKHYTIYKSTETIEKEITDNFDESNVAFGNSRGVLNFKPLQDDDMDFSSFVLTVRLNPSSADGDTAVLAKMTNRIRILPIDMGFVNDGERFSIDITNYVTLPKEEVILDWSIERGKEQLKLPSNMDVSENGQILTVEEFENRRLSTVIVCSIYEKKTGVFRAKRRFKFMKMRKVDAKMKKI